MITHVAKSSSEKVYGDDAFKGNTRSHTEHVG